MKLRVVETGEIVELPAFARTGRCCQAIVPRWGCTRDAGHVGPHVAHGTKLPITFWNDGDTVTTRVEPLEST